jgi:glyoxalase-like protein
MIVDHVVLLVPDATVATRRLSEQHGLGLERGAYQAWAGTRNHMVPLRPPAYLEVRTVEDREAAAAKSRRRTASP